MKHRFIDPPPPWSKYLIRRFSIFPGISFQSVQKFPSFTTFPKKEKIQYSRNIEETSNLFVLT